MRFFMYFKKLLAYVMPPPTRTFLREVRQNRDVNKKFQRKILKEQTAQRHLLLEIVTTQQKLNNLLSQTQELVSQTRDNLLIEQNNNQQKVNDLISRMQNTSEAGRRLSAEIVWAEVFNNTIRHSEWMQHINFSPGRWAVGYPFLYVLYRVLNEARPKRILDLGLGQSSRMIAQYAAASENIEHIIVEHDPEWINFFQNDFSLSANSRIVQRFLAVSSG